MPKGSFSKIVVILVIVLNMVFTSAMIYVYLQTGTEPSTLITCWYGFTTGELLALAGVKISKVRKGDGGNEN